MYIPLMPTIQKAFSVSTVMTTLTFSMVLFVMAFGTLLYGSASDRFGRKPVLAAGLVLFVAGSAVCAVASSFEVLIAGRFLQAVAAGCGVVLARAIARDVYGPDRLAQIIAYITAAYVVGPTVAPPVGGAISDFFGWNAVFAFATAASALVAVLGLFVIRETHVGRGRGRSVGALFADYARLVRNATFVCYALVPAFTSGAFFSLSIYASFLMADHYRGTSGEYGLFFTLLTLGFMSGNFVSGRLGNRESSEYMVLIGSVVSILTVELLAVSVMFLPDEPLALFLPGAFLGIAQGLSMPHAQAIAINAAPELAGTASGVVMFLHFMAAALASLFISALYDRSVFPLIEVLYSLTVASLAFAIYAGRRTSPV